MFVTLLFGACAFVYTTRQTPTYEAEASVEFQSTNQQTSIFGQRVDDGGVTPEQRAVTNASTLTRLPVLERAKEILKSPLPAEALAGRISARAESRTQLVIIQARALRGEEAARVANAVAEAAVDVTTEEARETFAKAAEAQKRVLKDLQKQEERFIGLQLRQEIARLEELSDIIVPARIRRRAGVPTTPVEAAPVRTTLLGLLVGLTFGLVAAFTRESLDRRFKNSRDITDEMHLPLLGFIPEEILGRSLVDSKRRTPISDEELENFRILRTNIEFLDVDEAPKVVLITSALPEEGKSTVSTGLAAAYAKAGKRTLVVEGDLRRPTLAVRLGVNAAPGLTDYLVGQASPKEVVQTIALAEPATNGDQPSGAPSSVPIVAITAGTPAMQPVELLRSKRCQEFLAQVREVYDVVILDTCPLLSVADTLELLPIADAVIVCVRASKTTRDQARAAKNALSHFPDRPTGVVVTGLRSQEEAMNYGYYSYGYVYGAAGR